MASDRNRILSTPRRLRRGVIGWMAMNPVAANLGMVVILAGGLLALLGIKQEVFPEFDLDLVNVTVPYPGASPAEVEQGIILAVEEAARGLDGVKRVTSVAAQGFGTVSVELLLGVDANKVLADVKSAVDRIVSFPLDAEKPTVALVARKIEVVTLVLAGDHPIRELHELAEKARADLIAHPDITQVEITGVRPLEVSIELSRETLDAYGMTLDEVADQIRAASIELPGGEIETKGGQIMVRVADRRRRGADFADIVLRTTSTGYAIRLGEIATIRDDYADTDQSYFYNGHPAVRVTAYRVADETPIRVAAVVREYAERLRREVPASVTVGIWRDNSELLAARIDLLVRNARIGLLLVLIILALFLDLRLAGWVAVGIPVSFLGAFLLMPWAGLSINMVTLFALIVTLGMVVDDAIIVGENVFRKLEEGLPRLQATIEGAREMVMPVSFSIFTTLASFVPLFFVPGTMGKIFRFIPAIVFFVLCISLLESFLILPAHLGHGRDWNPTGVLGHIHLAQKTLANNLARFIESVYHPILHWAMRQRYIVLAVCLALMVMSVAVVRSGMLPWSFFPKVEGDLVSAAARLPYGVAVERTEAVRRVLEEAAAKAIDESGGASIVRGMITRLGEGARGSGPNAGAAQAGSHLVTVELNLIPSDTREVSAALVAAAWERHTPALVGIDSLVFNHAIGPAAGAVVDVQLSHANMDVLARASEELARGLRGYKELSNVQNAYAIGKPQLDFHLKPEARTMGLTGASVARQIRSAFFGAEALREQRGRNEVKVMVRLPETERSSEYDLERLLVRAPSGGHVPLGYVVDLERSRAATTIRREEGRRIVNVSAELAPGFKSATQVLASLRSRVLPEFSARFPGLEATFVGQQREQQESFQALKKNYLLALFVIFALLAIPFGSYLQPLVIMSVIPFSLIGAIGGHLLMNFELSIISMFGIVALSGVVVNDSLVLVDAVNKARARGLGVMEAVSHASIRRLRPILLTSLTTFFGLAPLILETSVQARFLIPMAISLGFGVLFSTVLVLTLVPALFLILEDIRGLFGLRPTAAVGGTSEALVEPR